MSKTYAIVPAAGRGLRMGKDKPKQFLELFGESILAITLRALCNARFLSGIFLVVPADFIEEAESLADGLKSGNGSAPATPSIPSIFAIAGGAERQDSVFNGLRRLPDDCEWVLIHDGVRPFVSLELLEETRKAALRTGAAIAAAPATDTVKRVEDGRVLETLRRNEIWLVQTPQVFRKEIVLQAYEMAFRKGWTGTDDASFVERAGIVVSIAPGERSNIKVTTPEDLEWAEWFLARSRNART